MLRRLPICLLAALVSLPTIASGSQTERSRSPEPTVSPAPGHRLLPAKDAARNPARPPLSRNSYTPQILGAWSFEGTGGTPDPQGWTSYDATATLDTFFHVDDFAGTGGGDFGGLIALEGTKSLWCGTRVTDAPGLCDYGTTPGYGNSWDQRFESVPFPVSGTVTVHFQAHFDSEPGYDFTSVDYLSDTGSWRSLARFDGRTDSLVSLGVPPDSISGLARLRIRFTSDGVWSDGDGFFNTDGGVIVDALTVRDNAVIIDYQDFESESVGAMVSADGDWSAGVREAYGDFAALFDGTTVLQEDTLVTNTTWLWGFFNGSTETYACGGHPGQPAVPKPRDIEGQSVGIDNEIRSPFIPLDIDTSGAAVVPPEAILIEFDVYRDLPLDNLVYYEYRVRSVVDGCVGRWRSSGRYYSVLPMDWFRFQDDILPDIEPGTTHVQVAIAVFDLCPSWCGVYGTGACHSHAPLIDNVQLRTYGSDLFTVTNTDASGPGSFQQAIIDANRLGNTSTIEFAIPGTGPHTIHQAPELPLVSSPTIIDATSQPGYAGTPLVSVWNADDASRPGLRLSGGNSSVFGLEIRDYDHEYDIQAGIYVESDGNVVQANRLLGNDYGVHVRGDGNLIGGPAPGEGNEIGPGDRAGVLVASGTGNTIRGNRIDGNFGLGIDLAPEGVTVNDGYDADTGANDLLNYPTVRYVVHGSPAMVTGWVSGPAFETYTVDLYASPACDPSMYGEGAIYLGSTTVTTLNDWIATRFYTPIDSIPVGYVITATSTDAFGNTSEFSQCGGLSASAFVVTNTNSAGTGSLYYALQRANSSSDASLVLFDIPGPGPHTIMSTGNPTLFYPTIIDGFSQPGAVPNTNPPGQPDNAILKIELRSNGSNWGIIAAASRCVFRGLCVNGFPLMGLDIGSTAGTLSRVEGCRIGTDITGTVALPNGIGIWGGSSGAVVGGPSPDARNIISGNSGDGIYHARPQTRIWGNYIGVAADGVTPLGNGGSGVAFATNGQGSSQVGGEDPAASNVIAYNGGAGVSIPNGLKVDRNLIAGNSIYGNATLGIDLMADGLVAANDPGDGDSGANQLQNYPVLTGAVAAAGSTSVAGTLNTYSNAVFRIHCYATPTCDASGHGEGRRYLGAANVQADGAGVAPFNIGVPRLPPVGWMVTATATDSLNNTSEFSACVASINTPGGSNVVVTPEDSTGATSVTLTFDDILTPGNTTAEVDTACAELPATFLSGDSTCYNIETDAVFAGTIEVCITYDETLVLGPESGVRILHFDTTGTPDQWVDITTSVDTDANVVCGETTHLSPFTIGNGSVTAVRPTARPRRSFLHQNVPNPFNPMTTITYEVAQANTRVEIVIYDVAGRLVQRLIDGPRPAGTWTVTWDGHNRSGNRVATGVYFYRMRAGSFVQTRKMVLLK